MANSGKAWSIIFKFLRYSVWATIITWQALGAATVGTTNVAPTTASVGVATPILVTSSNTDPSLIAGSVNLQQLDVNGKVIAVVGTLHDDGLNGDAIANDGIYTIQTTLYQTAPTQITYRVSAAFKGSLLRSFSPPLIVNIVGIPTTVSIQSPSNLTYTNTSPVNVMGTVGDVNATVTINGVNAPNSNGKFQATVPLVEGLNTLTAVANNTSGTATTASVQVTLDTTPPHLTIDSPGIGTMTTASSVTVTGTANDVVVGTVNLGDVQVTVNGIAATVANRTYSASNVPLVVGSNTIQAKGVDRAGNGTTVTGTVVRVNPAQPPAPRIGSPVITNSLALVSGNNQTGTIGTALGNPLVVSLTTSSGQPLLNKPIVFSVTGDNGTVSAGGSAAAASVVVNTDANGHAQANWTLGLRSGAGINTVQASSALAVGNVSFTANGAASQAAHINVDSGNSQSGALGQALTFPLVAVVTDAGHNRVPNVPVTFTISEGGGNMNGLPSQTLQTDDNGRAIAVFTLGTQPGQDNNVVQANFPGNPGLPVAFSASALTPGNPSATSISGVVLDNSDNPLQGVTIRLYQTNQANNNNLPMQIGKPVQTDATGNFAISQAPVGFFKLMADGTTVAGPKSYPTLEYDLVTIAGQNNTVGTPIYLQALDGVNKLCVDATHGGTLILPQVPGFSLTVLPGSATFPGGSKTGCVSVTPVNGDKVPMAPGFGQQPRFIVTIQPVGTTFNPPAPITIPNVDGLKPRAVTEFYSYDHDLSMFVAIGTGTVSNDGSVIASNPGVGVLKAGWHCGGDPNTTGTAATCPQCQTCQGDGCVSDPSQDGNPTAENKCTMCKSGAVVPIPIDPTEITAAYTYGMPSEMIDSLNEDLLELTDIGIYAKLTTPTIGGSITTKQCCSAETGVSQSTKGQVTGTLGAFSFKDKIWPPGPIPKITVEIDAFGLAELDASFVLLAGVFANLDATIKGDLGYSKNGCGETVADQNGCVFADATVPLTISLTGQVGGSGDATFSCIFCNTTKISVDGTFYFGNLALPLNIGALTYNYDIGKGEPACSAGFNATGITSQPTKFTIGGDFSGSWQVNGGPVQTVKFSADVLSCTIDLTSGIKCPPYF